MTKRVGRALDARRSWTASEIDQRERELTEKTLRLFSISPEAQLESLEATTRRTIFQLREGTGARVWLASSKPDSGYEDLPGIHYHYPSHIPNGKQIAPGDVIILFRPKQAARTRQGIPELPPRAFAVACVARIEYTRNGFRKAHYSGYEEFDSEVPIHEPAGGSDPRVNRRNAIGEVPSDYLDELLARSGTSSPCPDDLVEVVTS